MALAVRVPFSKTNSKHYLKNSAQPYVTRYHYTYIWSHKLKV